MRRPARRRSSVLFRFTHMQHMQCSTLCPILHMQHMQCFTLCSILLIGALLAVLSVGCAGPASLPPSSRPAGAAEWNDLVSGIRDYEEGRYLDAARRFLRIIETYPGSALLEEAQWLLAKSYHGAREKEPAIRELRAFLTNYPQGAYREEARALLFQLERFDQKIVAVYWRPSFHKGLEEEFLSLQKKGFNAILLPVFDNAPGKSGLWFTAAGAPVLEDRLREWLGAAHRAGLRVFVETPLREMAWVTRSRPEWRDRRYDPKKRSLQAIDKLDLFNPDVRRMVLQLYRDLSRYPIDGIYLRDIYYSIEEGWTPSALDLYQRLFSERPDPAALFGAEAAGGEGGSPSAPPFWRWVGWRSRFISGLLNEIRMEIQSNRPYVQFGVGFPEALVSRPAQGLAEFSGDLLELKESHFDFYFLISGAGALSTSALMELFSKYAIRPEEVWLQRPISEADSLLSAGAKMPFRGVVFYREGTI